ncbi:MAG: chaperone protein ClpB, partial [Planctomycetes bacterium]|nr:chaperone protein ClpB [Planctomycetota bacterium]
EIGFDPTYGARPLKRAIQQEIENPLSLEILEGKFKDGSEIRVGLERGNVTFSAA